MTHQAMTQPESTPDDEAIGATGITITAVRFEHHREALGIGEARPRLSWMVATSLAGWRQASYEIEAYGPDGSVNPGQMTSFNHYALGAVADWLHRRVGGLAPAAPGYRHLEVRPRPGGGLTRARTQHLTPYGLTECAWKIEAGQLEMVVVVPPNTTASITLPGDDAKPIEVGSGRHHWSSPYHVEHLRHPCSLDSQISEFIDDPEAWTTVLSTMRQHLPGLTGDMDIATFMLHNSTMTLRQVLSLSPHADEVRTALEAQLAALGC